MSWQWFSQIRAGTLILIVLNSCQSAQQGQVIELCAPIHSDVALNMTYGEVDTIVGRLDYQNESIAGVDMFSTSELLVIQGDSIHASTYYYFDSEDLLKVVEGVYDRCDSVTGHLLIKNFTTCYRTCGDYSHLNRFALKCFANGIHAELDVLTLPPKNYEVTGTVVLFQASIDGYGERIRQAQEAEAAMYQATEPRKSVVTIPPFITTQPFRIQNLKLETDYPSTGSPDDCKGWELTEKEVHQVISEMQPISGPDWHYLYGDWPCAMTGTLRQNDLDYPFEMNAGAWMVVLSSDTAFRFGNVNPENDHLFMTGRSEIE